MNKAAGCARIVDSVKEQTDEAQSSKRQCAEKEDKIGREICLNSKRTTVLGFIGLASVNARMKWHLTSAFSAI